MYLFIYIRVNGPGFLGLNGFVSGFLDGGGGEGERRSVREERW